MCGVVVSPQHGDGLEDHDSGSWKVVVALELWGCTQKISWCLMVGNAGGMSVQK